MESRVESQTTPATFTNEAGPIPIQWGAPNPAQRGPIIATPRNPAHRNAIGVHAGGYAIYRGIAVATGKLQSNHVGDLTDTAPSDRLGPHPQWTDDAKIVSLDPWGHLVGESFGEYLARASPRRRGPAEGAPRRTRKGRGGGRGGGGERPTQNPPPPPGGATTIYC